MPRTRMTPARMQRLLPLACARDTSYRNDPNWSPNNPTLGHCTAASLLVQDFFGGDLLRIRQHIVDRKGRMTGKRLFHYFNRLPDGTIVDLTRQQFGREERELLRLLEPAATVRRRTEVLRVSDVAIRYRRLRRRFLRGAAV